MKDEVYEFHRDEDPQYVFRHPDPVDIYPYLLVNIGSGVSILQVFIERLHRSLLNIYVCLQNVHHITTIIVLIFV